MSKILLSPTQFLILICCCTISQINKMTSYTLFNKRKKQTRHKSLWGRALTLHCPHVMSYFKIQQHLIKIQTPVYYKYFKLSEEFALGLQQKKIHPVERRTHSSLVLPCNRGVVKLSSWLMISRSGFNSVFSWRMNKSTASRKMKEPVNVSRSSCI